MAINLLDYPFDASLILQKKRALKRELSAQEGLTPKNIALMSGVTIGVFKDILELFLLANGIKPTFYEGEYALFYEELVFDDGALKNFAPDLIYIHTSEHCLKNRPLPSMSETDVADLLAVEFGRFGGAATAALGFGCPVILNNFELPSYRIMGNFEGTAPGGYLRFIRRLNERLAALADETPHLYLNDLAYLQAQHGIDAFSDATTWYAYKYPCAMDKIPYFAQSVANIIKSIFGKNKKALVLDLDNTLWGGVIGDDGAEGIVLGAETPTGMAYTAFQQYLKELSALGVLLNVSSKNEEANALAGFTRSDSVLKREDFISFKANWEPKSQNIINMANEISLFPDSFVFMDDNPAEREIVRQQVAGVRVPELTAPEDYIKAIDRSGYFEVTSLSADDQKRVEMYKENAARTALQQSFGDYSDYLKSLDMTASLGAFDTAHAERITQLVNKSNQFNLTTRRYNAAEIETLSQNPAAITLYGQLSDKFGDNGIVSCVSGLIEGDTLDLTLWVMSCRVLKRDLEKAMFDCIAAKAMQQGAKKIRGHYYPTAKNLLVKDFYATIGFELVDTDEAGNKTYLYDVTGGYTPQCTVIDVTVLATE
ncbi:MAG: HAD-IIIC family phosphatase [Faecalibacterium sp.]